MKQIFVTLGAAAAFLLAVVANAAELRSDILVTRDQITLGDLFAGLPVDQANQPIASAPLPGHAAEIGLEWVERVAHAYGVAWTAQDDAVTIAIRRAGPDEMIGLAALLNADLSAAIVEQTAAPPTAPVVEEDAVPTVIEVPVLLHRVRPAEIITAADIGWIEVANDRRTNDIVLALDELIGMSPRRAITPSEPVRLMDLQPPTLVARGTYVTMTLQSGPILMTARGRALDDGAAGATIRVLNIDTDRTVFATVSGPETVVIEVPTSGVPGIS